MKITISLLSIIVFVGLFIEVQTTTTDFNTNKVLLIQTFAKAQLVKKTKSDPTKEFFIPIYHSKLEPEEESYGPAYYARNTNRQQTYPGLFKPQKDLSISENHNDSDTDHG